MAMAWRTRPASWHAAIPAALACVAAATRLRALLRAGGPRTASMVYDDGVYVAAGAVLRHGHVPYRDFVLVHPPVSTYLIAVVSWVVRDPADLLLAMRFAMVAVGIANVLLVHAIVRRHVGAIEAAVAGVVYAVLPETVYAEHTVILEPWLNLACLAAVVVWLSVDRVAPGDVRASARRRAFLTGALLALACSVKLWAGFCVLACLLVPPRGERRARTLELLAGGVAGAAVLWGPLLVLAPRRMIEQVVGFQTDRPADGIAGTIDRLGAMVRPTEIVDAGLARAVFVLVVVAAAVVVAARGRSRAERLACAWAALIVVAFTTSPTWWEQYSAHLAAPFALLAGIAAHGVVGAARTSPTRRVPAAMVALGAAVLLAAFVTDSMRYEAEHGDPVAQAARDIRRFVPADATVVSLEPGWLVAAGRLPSVDAQHRFAVDPYASFLLESTVRHASLRDTFDHPPAEIADAILRSEYLVVSDFRMALVLSPELRARIADEFVSLSDERAGIRVLAHR